MGYACNGLIPAAILLENPGITCEEFVELLNKTHSTCCASIPKDAPWQYHKIDDYKNFEEGWFNEGLHGLASCVLNLPKTEQYEKIQKQKKDKFGIPIPTPSLIVKSHKKNCEWVSPVYEVDSVLETKSYEPREITEQSDYKLRPGDIWYSMDGYHTFGLVEEILEEDITETANDELGNKQFMYTYRA